MGKKSKEFESIKSKIEEMKVLMRNIISAVDNSDSTALEQAAGAGREFLDKNPA